MQRSLPEAQRADIDRELRGTIADTIDAKVESGTKPDAAERETLTELGDPYKLAWGYADRPLHLIGPALFPDYIRLLRVLYFVVLPIVVVVVFLSLLLAKSLDGESLAGAFGAIWPTAIGVAVHLGFWTTLVFAVLERTTPQGRPLTKWDPSTLPQLPVAGTIKTIDTGAALVWLTIYIVVLVGQQFFSPLLTAAGDPLPVIDPALWSFWLPYFIGLAVLDIGVRDHPATAPAAGPSRWRSSTRCSRWRSRSRRSSCCGRATVMNPAVRGAAQPHRPLRRGRGGRDRPGLRHRSPGRRGHRRRLRQGDPRAQAAGRGSPSSRHLGELGNGTR